MRGVLVGATALMLALVPCPARAESADEEPAEQSTAWRDFELEGTHPFAGLVLGPAMSAWWNYRGVFDIEPALFFGLRGGVLFHHAELAFELAPVTWVPDFDRKPSLSFNVTIGGLVPIAPRVRWPLRAGVGLTALNLPYENVYMQARMDLIGLVYQLGHLLFEISLPSVRFSSEFDRMGIWGWLFNISVVYVI